jgi:hypothetical protein
MQQPVRSVAQFSRTEVRFRTIDFLAGARVFPPSQLVDGQPEDRFVLLAISTILRPAAARDGATDQRSVPDGE